MNHRVWIRVNGFLWRWAKSIWWRRERGWCQGYYFRSVVYKWIVFRSKFTSHNLQIGWNISFIAFYRFFGAHLPIPGSMKGPLGFGGPRFGLEKNKKGLTDSKHKVGKMNHSGGISSKFLFKHLGQRILKIGLYCDDFFSIDKILCDEGVAWPYES